MTARQLRNQDALMLEAMRAKQAEDHARWAAEGRWVGRGAPTEFTIHTLANIAPRGVALRRDNQPGHSDTALRAIARRLVVAGELTEHKGRWLHWTLTNHLDTPVSDGVGSLTGKRTRSTE